MAQTEDTELRDLVIEALEKNGSLAKIRALLRANVFLVFEDEGQDLKQNVSLDNILKLPEGVICLSIIHEFLEFCNLKNTLFVYMAESRQGTEYLYEGQKKLADKLNLPNIESSKEPVLITLLKQAIKSNQRKYFDQSDAHNLKKQDKTEEINFNDQNCTYIVHEDSNSSATSNSQSDNSSDEKNKLHLRLQLDNSDTDTSSDSARDKSSSEYIPSEHLIETNPENEKTTETKYSQNISPEVRHVKQAPIYEDKRKDTNYLQEYKLVNNSSSESTSYIDLKPYNPLDEKLLNTTGIPEIEEKESINHISSLGASLNLQNHELPLASCTKVDSVSETLSIISLKNEDYDNELEPTKISTEEVIKSNVDTAEYSNDFTSSSENKNIDTIEHSPKSPQSPKDIVEQQLKSTSFEGPRENSQSSQSSISISDVADLISERSSSIGNQNHGYNLSHGQSSIDNSKKELKNDNNKQSDESAEFSESPVPSLSNLSQDIQSD